MILKRFLTFALLVAMSVCYTHPLRAQWMQVSGPTDNINNPFQTGTFSQGPLSFFSKCGKFIFAGAPGDGRVFRSSDNGNSWQSTNAPFIYSIKTLASFDGVLLAGTGAGFFRSIDTGASWSECYPLATYVYSFGKSTNTLFAGGHFDGKERIARSTDSGKSWTACPSGPADFWCTAFVYAGGNIYAGADYSSGIYRSTNDGDSWTIVSNQGAIRSLAEINGVIVAGTTAGIFRSTDSGNHWIESNNGIPTLPGENSVHALLVQGESLLAGTDRGIYRSTDNGYLWSSTWLHGVRVFGLIEINGILTAGSDNGIFISNDSGVNWHPAKMSLGGTTPLFLAKGLGDIFASISPYRNVVRSSDNGDSWGAAVIGMAPNGATTLLSVDTLLFAGTESQGLTPTGLYVTTDHGKNWSQTGNGLTGQYIQSLASNGGMLFAGTEYGGVFRSTDRGQSWAVANIGLTNHSILALGSAHGEIFAASTGAVYQSTNNGDSWTECDTANGKCVAVSGFAALQEFLFVYTYSGHVFRSSDNGTHWTKVDSALGSNSVVSITAVDGNVFVGTNGHNAGQFSHVWYSDDNGEHWISTGTWGEQEVSSLVVSDGFLFASVTRDGIYRCSLSSFGINSVSHRSPDRAIIYSYPNPFSISTQINFRPVATGYADISIVDLLGAEVVHVFHGELESRMNTFTLNRAALANGVYECVVRMNGQVETLPLVLLQP